MVEKPSDVYLSSVLPEGGRFTISWPADISRRSLVLTKRLFDLTMSMWLEERSEAGDTEYASWFAATKQEPQ